MMGKTLCNILLAAGWIVLHLLTSCVGNPDFHLIASRWGRGKDEPGLPGCYLGGKHYGFGDRWSPVMRPVGLMVCLKCECLQVEKKGIVQTKGKVKCKNIKTRCPDVQCEKPWTLPGSCCKICSLKDDFETNMTFHQEKTSLISETIPSDDSSVLHQTNQFTALLTGSSTPQAVSSRSRKRTIATAAVRLTMRSSGELDFALRYSRLDRPKYLQIVDKHGTVQLQKPLVKSENGDKKMCGTWSDVPAVYSKYLHDGLLLARITTAKDKDGVIGGEIVPDINNQAELLSAILSPVEPDGTGGWMSASYTPGTSTAVFTVWTRGLDTHAANKGTFHIAVMHRRKTIFQTPELTMSKSQQLVGAWQIRRRRHRRQLAQGKLRMRVVLGGARPVSVLEGRIHTRLSCDVFQGLAGLVGSFVSGAVITFGDSGRMDFKVQTTGGDGGNPKIKSIYLEGSRPKQRRYKIWRRHDSKQERDGQVWGQTSGSYARLDLSSLHRLFNNRMYVRVTSGDGLSARGALVATGKGMDATDAESSWLTLPSETDYLSRTGQVSAHVQLSLDADCTPHLAALVKDPGGRRAKVKAVLRGSAESNSSDLTAEADAWWSETEETRFLRGYRYLQGRFRDPPDGMMLALDRGYVYLQLLVDYDENNIRTRNVQTQVSNSCWRDGGVLNSGPSLPATGDIRDITIRLRDQGRLEEQRDVTATLPGPGGDRGLGWGGDDDDDDDGDEEVSRPPPACRFEGQIHPEGTAWLPDVDARCTTCSCVKNKTICQRMICPKLSCSNPVTVDGECCPSCPETSSSETCRLGQDPRSYRLHSTWHPYLPLEGFTPCAVCTCLPGGRAVCNKTPCPVLSCDRSLWVQSDSDPCCYKCGLPPVTEAPTEIPQQDFDMQGACVVQNQMRRNGEVWHPNIQPFGFMKCFQCQCKDGHFKCEKLVCPRLTCARRKKIPNACCEVCEGEGLNNVPRLSKSKIKTPKIESKKRAPRKKKKKKKSKNQRKACKINNHTVYNHGERWRPKTIDSSQEKCAVCRCQNGKAKCRMRCPRICKTDIGKHPCCKHCKENDADAKASTSTSPKNKRKQNKNSKLKLSGETDLIHFLN